MSIKPITITPSGPLEGALKPLWLTVNRISGRAPNAGPKLREAQSAILSAEPISSWNDDVAEAFLEIASRALDDCKAPLATLELLISFAVAFGRFSAQQRLAAASVWTRALLRDQWSVECDVPAVVEEVASLLLCLDLPVPSLTRAVEVEFANQVAATLENASPANLNWAREACLRLLEDEEFRNRISSLAGRFGIVVASAPTAETLGTQDNAVPKPAAVAVTRPFILPEPRHMGVTELKFSYADAVFDLSAYTSERAALLTAKTREQIDRLDPTEPGQDADRTFYFAAQEFWRIFAATGDRRLISLVAKLAEFLLARCESADRDQRANALHLWASAQVARKIRTSSLDELLRDIQRLLSSAAVKQNDLWIRESLLEAAAAECKALEIEGDIATRGEFVAETWTDVQKIHSSYISKAKASRFEPREEEQAAFDYLKSFAGVPISRQEPGIRSSEDFRKVINRGSADDIYQFTVTHNEDIQRLLESRLGVRLGLDHVVEPDGDVYDGSKRKGVLNATFVQAKKALSDRDYDAAARLFERASQKTSGINSDIAKSYQGYALAKLGGHMPARLALQELCDSGFSRPTAYWNLACCILSEEMDQQLEVLALGLQRAPHPRLLAGAVYVGMYSNHPRLLEWLPCLTLTEALLLYYKLDSERTPLTSQVRQAHVLRLGRYALEGEPVMPSIGDANVSSGEVEAYLNALLERMQPAAFDFWLSCREARFQRMFKHWQVKADFLERVDRKADAAKAFHEELAQRIHYFGKLIAEQQPLKALPIIKDAAPRLAKWLTACMTPDLKSTGFRLYTLGEQFERQYSDRKATLLPTTSSIRKYYRSQEDEPVPDFDKLLVLTGADLKKRYRDLADLPSVRGRLDLLVSELVKRSHRESQESLSRLVEILESYSRLSTDNDRRLALEKLHAALGAFRKALQRELTESQLTLAAPVIEALQGVNDGIARQSKLLPEIAVTPLNSVAVEIQDGAPIVVPFRLSVGQGQGTARLKNVTGLIDGEFDLALRDRLGESPVFLSPESPVILTVAAARTAQASSHPQATLSIQYEYAGSEYTAPTMTLAINVGAIAQLPPSPYIYNRPLDVTEIETHFFGRGNEQSEILASVKKGVVRYVEGIQRTGKSTLLRSIEYVARKHGLPLIPVLLTASGVSGVDHAGRVLYNVASTIADRLVACNYANVVVPSEERFCENLPGAYAAFERSVAAVVRDSKVVVLFDDFNLLVDAAVDARSHNPALTSSITALLNTIRATSQPSASCLWVVAGHRTLQQYKKDLPGVDLWSTLKALPIDFLKIDAVGQIIRCPVGNSLIAPDETVRRVHELTAGHPELVQKIAELMLNEARSESRRVITPADADEAARYLALYSDDPFAGAWIPESELRRDHTTIRLLVDFVQKVPIGGRTTLHALVAPADVTERHVAALKDLESRKILHQFEDGYGVRARVLDLWLHHRMVKDVQWEEPGSPAVFVDVANLTSGKGSATLTDLDTLAGDGVPGRFSLKTVLQKIEKHVIQKIRIPIAGKYTVNYPAKCAAVMECAGEGYYVDSIPEYLFEKAKTHPGVDDAVLIERISTTEQQFPNVQHFFIITGDKDYRIKIEKLLTRGKHVHIISRRAALGNPDKKHSYDTLAAMFPDRFTLTKLEDLLER